MDSWWNPTSDIVNRRYRGITDMELGYVYAPYILSESPSTTSNESERMSHDIWNRECLFETYRRVVNREYYRQINIDFRDLYPNIILRNNI